MDIQLILAIVGVIATLILGVWGIVVAVRYNRSVRMTYAFDQAIALTDDILQNFPDLNITYRGDVIDKNLVLLKGYFINTGKKDITREMVEQTIAILLPPDYEWVEYKVAGSSPSLTASVVSPNTHKVELNTGLWKSGEYVKFEALAKVPFARFDPESMPNELPAERLRKSLSFEYRISDLPKIEQTYLPLSLFLQSPRRIFREYAMMSSMASFIFLALVVFGTQICVPSIEDKLGAVFVYFVYFVGVLGIVASIKSLVDLMRVLRLSKIIGKK